MCTVKRTHGPYFQNTWAFLGKLGGGEARLTLASSSPVLSRPLLCVVISVGLTRSEPTSVSLAERNREIDSGHFNRESLSPVELSVEILHHQVSLCIIFHLAEMLVTIVFKEL